MFWFNPCRFLLLCSHTKGELLTDFDSTTANISSQGQVCDYNLLIFTTHKTAQKLELKVAQMIN